jgi:polysaccharide biosynthesis/export protein
MKTKLNKLALGTIWMTLLVIHTGYTQEVQEQTTVSHTYKLYTVSETDDRYRIGPADVLDIRVFNRPQLSRDSVRVDNAGMIRMPFIETEIQAACKTESELARDIAAKYLKYQRNPQVEVYVKEVHSQPVAVIGAVNSPGRFQMQRRIRLLELLTFAGGPAEKAGQRIHVIRNSSSLCELDETEEETAASLGLKSYSLTDTLRGDDKSNPVIKPGDVISLPEAEQAFIVGNVFRPAPLSLKEPLSVSRAIAMAGGVLPDTRQDRIRIIRQDPKQAKKIEIVIDLKAIEKRKAEDIALQAGDIVEVPTSGTKRFLRTLAGSVIPSLSQLPVQVIR